MKILIVDDSRAMQTIVKRIVVQAGYDAAEFELADAGDQALDLIRKQKPNLVLLDWHMPGLTGLDVLNTLRDEKINVCVGLVTTERTPQKIDAARKAGAKFIIHKPFTVEQLKETLVPVLAGIDPDDEERPLVMPKRASMEKTLAALCNAPVRVVDDKTAPLNPQLTPFMLALLHDNKDRLRAIALLDQNLIIALGGAFSNAPNTVVQQAMNNKTVPDAIKQSCDRVMRVLSASFYDPVTGGDLTLKSAHLIDANFGKLKTLYERAGVDRLDFIIEIKAYGGGRFIVCAERR